MATQQGHIQYTKNGKLNWANTFNGPGNFDDFATAIAADNTDNVYITGASTGVGSSLDYATIKYSAKGELQWTQRFNGAVNGTDAANDIAVDSTNNVYVTGASQGTANLFEFATVKYVQIQQATRIIGKTVKNQIALNINDPLFLNFRNSVDFLNYNAGVFGELNLLEAQLITFDDNNRALLYLLQILTA